MKRLSVIAVTFVLIMSSIWIVGHSSADSGGISPLTGEIGYSGKGAEQVGRPSLTPAQTMSALVSGGLYGTDGSNLYIIDKTTGTATLIGPHGSVEYGIGALAFDDAGVLYGISLADSAKLYTIDPNTGVATAVGMLGIGFVFEGGLDFNASGQLFGVNQGDANNAKMFTINTASGAALVLGPNPGESRDIDGLAFDGQIFYAIDRVSNTFGSINPTTGAYSPIGNPGAVIGDTGGLAIDPNDGKIYATFEGTGGFYTIDKSTGHATLISINNVDFGLAFAPIIGIEADLGFRPNPDGYNFDNYGNNFPLGNYDFGYNELIRMFGQDDVCWMVGSVCFVKPSADWWHYQANRAMNGGHCDGMASTSLRFFKGLDNPSNFQNGANTTHDLQLGNTRRHIAYYFVEQMTNPVMAYKQQIRQNSPSAILEQLRAAMSGDAVDPTTLFVRQAGQGGHAITPYAIENKGDNVYWVKVYDNNHPNDANRHVVINTTSNSWSYNLGWTTWSGDSNTHSLGIVPISKYGEQPVCPWCSNTNTLVNATVVQAEQVWLTGQSHLLISDSQGRHIGYVGNQFVNEVPGAYESIIDNGLGVEQEPIYTLPLSETYSILLDGQTLAQTENVTLAQFGPGYATTLSNLTLSASSKDLLAIAADGKQLTYQPSSNQTAILTLALDGSNQSNQLQIIGADIGASQTVTLSVNFEGSQLVFDNSKNNGGIYDFEVIQMNTTGKQVFIHSNLVISATDTHFFDYGGIGSTDVVTLKIDHGSDGTIDETIELENQITLIYLPLIMK